MLKTYHWNEKGNNDVQYPKLTLAIRFDRKRFDFILTTKRKTISTSSKRSFVK